VIVAGIERGGPAAAQGEFFQNRKRPGARVTEVVLHETVTRSHADTIAVLKKQGLGVHLIVDEHGAVHQHGDLERDLLWHASEHNGPSVGIELVNPYEPRFLPKIGPWQRVIRAPWAAGGWYVVPTLEQAETMSELVAWLTSTASGLAIPRTWVGLAEGKLALTRIPNKALRPGLWAHTYFAHADGAWPALYAWLRLEGNRTPEDAYATAISWATGNAGAVTLTPLEKERR
jgi:hypothetical protein